MKRLLTSAALFLCSLLTFAQFSGSGSGTERDPYLILNPIQLNQLRNFLNQENVYFKLMADIDLTEFLEDENPSQGWQPIGTSSAPFKGILEGNGKTISGLWINRSGSDNVGFTGYTNGATIKDLTIAGTTINGNDNVGFLVGYSKKSTFENVNVSGIITGNSMVGGFIGGSDAVTLLNVYSMVDVSGRGDYVGGIIGKSDLSAYGSEIGNIGFCSVKCNNISGNNYVGGICGANLGYQNHMTSCYVYANISGYDYVGGICGITDYEAVGNCYLSTNVSNCGYFGYISGNSNVGGLFGKYSRGTISGCFAVGEINASGDNIGGLLGFSSLRYYQTTTFFTTLRNSYFNGFIHGNNKVGGLIGYNYSGDVKLCCSCASVYGNEDVGGLIGYIEGLREWYYGKYASASGILCSNVANVNYVQALNSNVGRVYGSKGNYVEFGQIGTSDENKALNRTVVINAGVVQDMIDGEQNGVGVSLTTLKLKATYVAMGWDFTNTWEIQETECYPYMKSQTAPPVIQSKVVSGATTVSGKCVDGGTVTLEIDGVKQQMMSTGNTFSFTVSPLQAGHEVRVSAKADGKEQSYFTTEVVSFLGKGTETDPYQISTAADLTQVYRKGYYKLMNDIDLTSYINQFSPTEGWQSIGRDGSETIHFDGNGHKITGLWCNSTRDNTGLFSCFANGNIKDLTVETAAGKQVKGGANTGILIGKMINGTIDNCRVSGNVADGTPVGGMVGLFDGGKISLSQTNVTINTTGEKSYIGGLVGEITGGEIDQCVTLGTLTAKGKESHVGGLVGKNSATVTNCYSNANVTSTYNAAGLIAYNYGVVDKCYATGNLASSNYGAGIIGYNDGANAVIKNSAAMNNKIDVTYESQSAQGGGYGMRIIGGIKNNAPAPEMNNYALKTMQVSVNNVSQKVYDDIMNGTAKTLAQLKSKATYEELGWDFNTIWKIEEESSYPYQTEIIAVADNDEPENPNQPVNPDNPETISVTDVSNLTNAIYAQSASSQPGNETVLNICLKNAQAATAYSFDLQLPEGVTLAKDNNGDYQYTLSNRHNGHGETVNYQAGTGVYSFAVLSLQTKQISGNEGAIWTLKLKVADNVANGDYAVKISNAKYSLTSGSAKVNLPETTSKLTISQYKKGDANNDGDVDIADAVCIVNHVVGLPTPSFVEKAADANGDGDVDIADAVRIVNLVVGKINALSRGNGSHSRAATRAGETTDAILIDATSVFIGKEGTLTVSLKNSQKTNAYSFDMVLPEGVSIVQDDDDEYVYELSDRHNGHMSTLNYIGNNTYSFAILSLQSKEVSGNDGAICRFKVKADDTAVSGKHAVTIQNAKYSLTSGAAKVTLPEATGQLTIKKLGDANGDGNVTDADVKAIADYIMGKTPEGFDMDAADANQDTNVDAADIVTIIKYIKEME